MDQFKDNFRLTTASLLGLSFIALLLLAYLVVPQGSRRFWAIAGGGTWLTAVAYITVLFLVYRYVSNSRNGFELSSYIRYAHSMLLPVVLMSFAPLVPAFTGNHEPHVRLGTDLTVARNATIFTLALAALVLFERPYVKPLYTVQQPPEMRVSLQPLTDSVRSTIGDAPLWVFLPNNVENGFIGQLLQFQLSPGRTHVEEDAAALLDDPMALKDELRHWDYAWFVGQNPEIDAALERVIGGKILARLFRIHVTDEDVLFEPVAAAPAESES